MPMKICFIIHDLSQRAGTERAQINLANALSSRGESISIWSCYWRNFVPGFSLSDKVEIAHGKKKPFPHFLDYPWLIVSFAFFVLRRRPNWIVCTDTNRLIVALLAVFIPGVHLAVWEHYALSHSAGKARGKIARKLASRLATRIVTLTDRDTDLYHKYFNPRGTVTTIPNIVFPPEMTERFRKQEILALGRLVPQKGYDLLLEAWSLANKRLPDWFLRIVGEGAMLEELKELAKKFKIGHCVVFDSFSEFPFMLYSECGIFVLSSRFEGLPFVLIEAMICGAPCISFDCPNGPREVINNGVNGLLVPSENVTALADTIVKLAKNQEMRQHLGENARKIAKFYSKETIADRWIQILGNKAES